MVGRVEGKVAFITGAARGQGRAHALRLAEEGADIVAIDICTQVESVSYPLATAAELEQTKKDLEACGARVIAAEADVRDPAALTQIAEEALDAFGRLDVVCANAGISSYGSFSRLSDDMWRDVIDINLTGVWNTCRAAVPSMLAAGNGGSIILTSSVAGLKAMQNLPHYVAAKHGVVGLMRALALELARKQIRVNSIHPGTADTAMVRNDQTLRLFVPEEESPDIEMLRERSAKLNALPIGLIDPVDLASAVLFLASDESRYITGVTLPVDAGYLLK